jgi:hypothetical protein
MIGCWEDLAWDNLSRGKDGAMASTESALVMRVPWDVSVYAVVPRYSPDTAASASVPGERLRYYVSVDAFGLPHAYVGLPMVVCDTELDTPTCSFIAGGQRRVDARAALSTRERLELLLTEQAPHLFRSRVVDYALPGDTCVEERVDLLAAEDWLGGVRPLAQLVVDYSRPLLYAELSVRTILPVQQVPSSGWWDENICVQAIRIS